MRSIAALIAVLLATLTLTSAYATVRIRDDMGGLMTDYASRFADVRNSGEKVVIDGSCFSACTMLLGMLPREQVCVTPNAVLGFHAAWNFDDSGRKVTSPSATRELLDLYPRRVRSWIARRGGLSPRLMLLRGRELSAIFPLCSSERNDVASAGADRAPHTLTRGHRPSLAALTSSARGAAAPRPPR